LNSKNWEAVREDLKTNERGEFTYKGRFCVFTIVKEATYCHPPIQFYLNSFQRKSLEFIYYFN
jgi:hypothetical protein